MSDFKTRLVTEESELNERIEKLRSFLKKANSKEITGAVQHDLLEKQLVAMENYSNILHLRLKYIEMDEKKLADAEEEVKNSEEVQPVTFVNDPIPLDLLNTGDKDNANTASNLDIIDV